MNNVPAIIGTYKIHVIDNPSQEESASRTPKVYAVTNIETGIDEMYTMQLPQAFIYAVQSGDTIAKAKQMIPAAPFERKPRELNKAHN